MNSAERLRKYRQAKKDSLAEAHERVRHLESLLEAANVEIAKLQMELRAYRSSARP